MTAARHLLSVLLATLGAALPATLAAAPAADRLNVVLILADDLGWTDLGCYGSDFYRTPHLDRLARDGVRFTQAYSACTVCSPTRAAILTGQYPARLRVTDWIPGRTTDNPKLLIPAWTKYLPLETVTVAERLKSAAYITASIGKWHLGQEAHYPGKHGFDINIAGTREGSPRHGYFAPYQIPTLPEGPAGEYLTDRIGDEAVRFIERHRDRPFFLYVPHFAVHTPIQAKQEPVEKYRALVHAGARHTNPTYAAMIESMDDTVGRIRAKLTELGLDRRTLVIFASDNGGHLPTTSNAPLRVGKGSAYEGGVRVPFIVYWPGHSRAGLVTDYPTISTDILPTILAITGITDESGQRRDGIDLSLVLRGQAAPPRGPMFWHYPHYQFYQQGGTSPYGAIRDGDYKLIEFFDDMRVELYNIRADIGETRNLATVEPERVAALRARLHMWRESFAAQMPRPNPAYDPSRPEQQPGLRRAPDPFE